MGYLSRMKARRGLRNLNPGQICRKVVRADGGNELSDTL
ncbi:MAG: hypothetical protein RHS_3365 [Robinsoniella sp. RHS]|nr:MAG: hypothetical protein RHS_3365 [Robinsoniella sp. RHS]